MLRLPSFVAALLALALGTVSAQPDRRVALVVGNSAYSHVQALPNPANDANTIAAVFKSAGFDVVDIRRDLGAAALRQALREFTDATRDADIAVVFYAGHGIEMDGTNYLIPTDARLASDFDVEDETVSLDRILKVLEPARRLRLIILDACRDNPFLKTMKRSIGTRSIGRGLAEVKVNTADTMIAFAARAGSVANDGSGGNSPFTAALAKYIALPDLDLRVAFGKVRDDVLASTGRKQEPFVYGSLGGDIVSIVRSAAVPRPAAVASPSPATDPDVRATQDYELAERIGTREAWDLFLGRYSTGYYADLARAARSKLATVTATPRAEPAKTPPPIPAPVQVATAAPKLPPPAAPLTPVAVPPAQGGPFVPLKPFWDYKGSRALLESEGAKRKFYYESPRESALGLSVSERSVVFEGLRNHDSYQGTAYALSKTCHPLAYRVSGFVSNDDRKVTLSGKAPQRDEQCRIVGYRDDELTFILHDEVDNWGRNP